VRIAAVYSFNRGNEEVTRHYADLMVEVNDVIRRVEAAKHRTKRSKEKTMRGRMLFDPPSLNRAFKRAFESHGGWETIRVKCAYSEAHYVDDYTTRISSRGAFREMDFVKRKLGIEVQFGKYAFMVYNVCAKMTIFQKLGYIDCGVEIVPVKAFADQMSTGVSYFEQFVWDLEQRGVADIDIPVLILGIDA
jgi:hypothetical protein